ncbi:arylsulfatase [Candidatus Epulonipiscium viviparus]|uniref:arylsulfatase n=1 Tax=Candidatus Epulonipiscium viviparus TaxID=420336 RepID=UPI0027381167|nr:arylsulfatase [Candidatus Epulopiscium viviparus]
MQKKPNVIIILTDDQGYGDMAAHGNPWLKTPNLDWLNDNAISLESFHTDPLCAPSRAALISGKYSFGAGVYSTLNGRYYMDPNIKTIANYFKDGGYATAMFGKWHLGDVYPYRPENRGFDVATIFGGGVIGETPDYWNNDYFDDTYQVNGKNTKFEGYCTDVWFDSATKFIDDQLAATKPFFCYLPTNAPHGPFNIAPSYYQKYIDMGVPPKRAKFFGMIEGIDENIGKLMDHLRAKNAFDDTIIIFFGDNGTATGCDTDKNGWVKDGFNAGMRGKKGTTYEGAHRNTCFITTPKNILGEARKVYGLTAQFDLLPTLIDICGLPEGENLDGVSMAQALKAGETHLNEDRVIMIHNMQLDMPQKYKDYTVLKNNMRLVRPLTNESNPMLRGSFGSSKDVNPEIYNIDKDLYEEHDCYEENQELAIELTRCYEEWYDDRLQEAMKFKPFFLMKNQPITMTAHAWHECTKMTFSQRQIREGVDSNGYLVIEVVDPGTYKFELRRYPREADLALAASCEELPATECIADGEKAGKIYNIVAADIRVASEKKESTVAAGAKEVVFEVNLTEGMHHLRTRFFLENGKSIGAYYVYAEKVD